MVSFIKIIIFFSCVMPFSKLSGMEQIAILYDQDTINNFDPQKHTDPSVGLHYGFIYEFTKDIQHKNFPACSVQEGLKKGQNVYVDDNCKTLIITEKCTHWIDIDPKCTDEENKAKINNLIDSINSLNTNSTGTQVPRFDTIHIYIDVVVDNFIHRLSTALFTTYLKCHFFKELKHIKNIYYLPDYNDKEKQDQIRIFVRQDIFSREVEKDINKNGSLYKSPYLKEYYFPLVLMDPDKQYSILINGVINKRRREDKNRYDTIFFTESNGESTVEEYVVMVHPDIAIQEVVFDEKSLCNDNIHRKIGISPVENGMKEYPLNIIEGLARQYAIHTFLLMTSHQYDQWESTCERLEDKTFTYCSISNQSLGECLRDKGHNIFIDKYNILNIQNHRIDGIHWIKTEGNAASVDALYDTLAEKLYFLCWLKNINTIKIHVPESFPNDAKNGQSVNLHSLALISSYSLSVFKRLSSIIKTIEYVPYNFYNDYNVNNRFLYIHPDVKDIFPIRKYSNEQSVFKDKVTYVDYLLPKPNPNLTGLSIAQNIEMREFLNNQNQNDRTQAAQLNHFESGPPINNNMQNKKNSSLIFNRWVLGAIVFSALAYLISKYNTRAFNTTTLVYLKNFLPIYLKGCN